MRRAFSFFVLAIVFVLTFSLAAHFTDSGDPASSTGWLDWRTFMQSPKGGLPAGIPEAQVIAVDEDDYLMLVNKQYTLPAEYVPSDLRRADIQFVRKVKNERTLMRDRAATALEELFRDARSEGIHLLGISGYRSYETQRQLYRSGSSSGATQDYIAYPGRSEHQAGLAMDVGCEGIKNLTEEFADTREGLWLKENAHRYGFIIRYPKDAREITGYAWEPWHIRYVGDAAAEIYERGIVLETYLGK